MRLALIALMTSCVAHAQQVPIVDDCLPKQFGGTGVNYAMKPVLDSSRVVIGAVHTWYCGKRPRGFGTANPLPFKTKAEFQTADVQWGYSKAPIFTSIVKSQMEVTKP